MGRARAYSLQVATVTDGTKGILRPGQLRDWLLALEMDHVARDRLVCVRVCACVMRVRVCHVCARV